MKKYIKYIITLTAFFIACFTYSCSDDDHSYQKVTLPDSVDKGAEEAVLQNAHDTRILTTFDGCEAIAVQKGSNSPSTSISTYNVADDIKEGEAAMGISYTFTARSVSPEPEFVSIEHTWDNYRPDLGFEPLGLSVWIKGNPGNPGVFRMMLIQDDKMVPGMQTANQYFQYVNKTVLQNDGWIKLVIPYSSFSLYKGFTGEDKINPSRVIGYRIDIVNEKDEAKSGTVVFDDLQQVTSYQHNYTKKAKLSSIFIQLNAVYNTPEYNDWDTYFQECKAVGIDTWIIQYSVGYGVENNISWYTGSTVGWNGGQTEYDIIDKMVAAAERRNFKLIFGLNGGDYDNNKLGDKYMYDVLLARNEVVANDLFNKFGSSPAFAGWYITEEFHDAKYPAGWQMETERKLLAQYLQRVAAYVKSLADKPVLIAPALWRGMPADMCGQWFEDLLKDTHDIDYMYLQDLAGRCLVDVRVDLPNYYTHIKKACENAGVQFAVDIESFLQCGCPDIPYRAKSWAELEEQIAVASQYTEYITNFSWATFKPGYDSFEGYRAYYNSLP
ncbi:DUF4434 domain-containing protein [Prevotella sp. 10(H)]|uniref:DUF4434 domain-containing protein n=1 Tax=Prevotella sp. 10(H) TaxID=1158294 RepID=UPI0004A6D75E|nr:DUF4434 domain-containing protein [Prevotella sp. 10(H)]